MFRFYQLYKLMQTKLINSHAVKGKIIPINTLYPIPSRQHNTYSPSSLLEDAFWVKQNKCKIQVYDNDWNHKPKPYVTTSDLKSTNSK